MEKQENYEIGLYTLVMENGKPYKLLLEDETLRLLGFPDEEPADDLYYQWFSRVAEEDRPLIKRAILACCDGLQPEVRYRWDHFKKGMVNVSCTGILAGRDETKIIIKGFFKTLPVSRDNTVQADSALYKTLLADAMVNKFELCALIDSGANEIFFLSGGDELSAATYDEWRERVMQMVFSDDAEKFAEMTDRNNFDSLFERYDDEYQLEARCRFGKGMGYRRMKVRCAKLAAPIAGRFGEYIVFSEIKAGRGENYKEMLRRRLIDGLALPYRRVDLINLQNGRLYSSRSGQGKYTESFEEMGAFDDTLTRFFKECDLNEDEYAAQCGKFLTSNLYRYFLKGGKLLESELKHRDPLTGQSDWVRIQAFVTAVDEESRPFMAIVTVMSINEEKERTLREKRRLEFALRSERQYKRAILSTAMAVYTYNLNSDTLYEEIIELEGTKALLPQLGLSTPCSYNEYVMRKSGMITNKKDAELFKKRYCTEALLDMYDSNRYSFESDYGFRADGKEGYFRETVILTKDYETGEVWGLTCVRNITREHNESRRIEQALRDAYHHAQRANSSKTLFMSQMSHDIRTPLNSILGMAAIAREHIDDSGRVADCMDKIDYAGHHLLEIINNVLDLSAIESGKTVLSQENFDLKSFLEEMLGIMQPLADKRSHNFTADIGEMHGGVLGDRTKLRQLLVNVISNAIKYTPDGGNIRFTARELEPERHDVCRYMFVVEDNGIGMSQEFLKKVFDPFARADTNRVSGVQGTGLGMAISRNIARMMNGDINVQSTEGKGSRVEITVCLKRGEDTLGEHIGEIELSEPKRERMSDYDFSGRRVLIAEDLDFNAQIAAEFLSEAGITSETAQNGVVAVEMFQRSKPGYYDLIFMDIQMPELDGCGAAEKIRALDRPDAADIPIIAMTANAFIEDVRRTAQSGMNGHIAKPIEVPCLLEVLTRYFGECRREKKEKSESGEEK